MSKPVKLQSGHFTESAEPFNPAAVPDKLDRDCLLVYMGEFESMDGPVKIDEAHLERMVEVHNAFMSKVSRMATGEVPIKYCPPIQLDHSTSAKDTVGRLVGDLKIGKYDQDGEEKLGMYGKVRILGKENVERVMDGRWTHVSIGADLDTGKITELTITPFPAADNASLMSKKRLEEKVEMPGRHVDEKKWDEAKAATKKQYPDLSESNERFWEIATTIYENMGGKFSDGDAGKDKKLKGDKMKEKLKAFLMKFKRMSEADAEKKIAEAKEDEKAKMAEEAEKHEKMKKHLVEHEKMSAEEADKKMSLMSPEEIDKNWAEIQKKEAENEKREAEVEDEEKKEIEKIKKEMSAEVAPKGEEARMKAAKEKMIALHRNIKTGLVSHGETVKLTGIVSRLQKLRSECKITPAEMKKIDMARLSKCNDATIKEVLDSYEKREPVIIPIMLSTTKAEQITKIHSKYRLQIAELESRLNMPSKKAGAMEELARLKRFQEAEEKEVNVHIDTTPHTHYEMAYDALAKMLDEGHDKERIKTAMREHMKKLMDEAMKSRMEQHAPSEIAPIDEAKMSALAESTKLLQNQFSELTELMSGAIGISSSELNQGGK